MRSLFVHILMFLFCLTNQSKANGNQFSQSCCLAVEAMLYCDFNKAENIILSIEKKEPNHIALPYLKQYKQFMAFLVSDEKSNYEAFNLCHNKAMETLQADPAGWHLVFSSNMLLQKSLVEFSRGNHFQGALALYQSYKAFRKIESNNTNKLWHLKLRGIFNILWDRIPDNLHFISNLAGYKGNYYMGLRQLVSYHDEMLSPGLADESKIILLYVHQLFQQDNENLVKLLEETLVGNNPPLTLFLYSGILGRLSYGQKALEILQEAPKISITRFPLLQYQYARILLNAGYIEESKTEMIQFIGQYRGDSFCSDAYLQMSRICYLIGNDDEASEWSLKCLGKQPANSAIDRQAIEECRQYNQWQPTLLRARLFFDHGDYEKSQEWVSKPINMPQAKIEQQYRKGRIAHKKGELAKAIQSYNRAIELASKDVRYYGPYAALFCAEIKIATKEFQEAIRYLAKARKLNKGEYRQTIDNKIKQMEKEMVAANKQ